MVFLKKSKKQDKQFEQSCVEHMDSLFASALRLTKNADRAEELVQDTYVKAFRFQKTFEPGTNLKTWLFRILTNTFINDYRRNTHKRNYEERAAVEPIYDEMMNSQAAHYVANPEKHLFTKFFKQSLDKALLDLPDDFRIVVTLADLQSFSYKEISDMLDCPIGTVMSRLHRGRKLLQKELMDFALAEGIVNEKSKVKEKTKEPKAINISDYRKNRESV